MKDKEIKRKLVENRTFPDADSINKRQDFSRLQNNYSAVKTAMFKKVMLWSGAVVFTASVAAVVVLNTKAADNTPVKEAVEQQAVKQPAQPCIQPPLPGQEPPYAAYRISAKTGGIIHYASGTSITIPPNAFVSSNGQPVSDSIELRYREFHTPLDIFLSGIPMSYDSAGTAYTLETAGMIELLAFDKGQPLALNGQAKVNVRMASDNNDERFNLYELDTVAGNWVYKGKDKIEQPEKTKVTHTTRAFSPEPVAEEHMARPQLSDPHSYTFRIGYDKNEFPELAAYDNVLFEVTDNSFKPAYYKINWKKISLYAGDAKDVYIIRLKKADTTISVSARPVFDKEGYAAAMTKFEERHKAAGKAADEAEMKKMEALNKVNNGLTKYRSNQAMAAASAMANTTVYRVFAIVTLGVHNIDFPLPPIVQYAMSLKWRKPAAQQQQAAAAANPAYNTVFLVEKGKNTVFRFSKGEPVRCNPGARNLMWTVTDNSQIAFFRISDYKSLMNGAEHTVEPVVAKNRELALAEIKKFSEEY